MNVYIADSPIHGRGVFAYASIEQDQWQWIYGQRRMVKPAVIIQQIDEEGQISGKDEKYGYESWMDYCFEWDSDSLFMPEPPWRFVNHGEDPNCEVTEDDDTDNVIMVITALRDIETNEELVIDYGYDPSTD